MGPQDWKETFTRTFREWRDDDALQWGAALAYYAALSLAPLLLILLTVATLFLDQQTVRAELVSQARAWMGDPGAELASTVLRGDRGGGGLMAGLGSTAFLIVGATGLFSQLQKALDDLWEVAPDEGGLRRLVKGRILGFFMVLGLGALLFAAVVVQSGITAVTSGALGTLMSLAASLVVFTLLFAGLFKVLPDVEIYWKEVWVGAGFTAFLFVVGQWLIGLYLGHSSVGSAYGAAGSLIALLVWIYYSSQTLFFGAEFTQVWARRQGRRIQPEAGAHRVVERAGDPID